MSSHTVKPVLMPTLAHPANIHTFLDQQVYVINVNEDTNFMEEFA
jgi:hypothetical protein